MIPVAVRITGMLWIASGVWKGGVIRRSRRPS